MDSHFMGDGMKWIYSANYIWVSTLNEQETRGSFTFIAVFNIFILKFNKFFFYPKINWSKTIFNCFRIAFNSF